MTALLPSLILPTTSASSPLTPSPAPPSPSHSRTKWTPADPAMPVSFVSLANSSFEEDHYEIGLETLAGFCSGEFAPSVSHLLILLHLSLTSPSPPTIQSSSLSLLTLISTLNSPRSLLQAIPPNTTGSRFDDERDISNVEQLSRRIIRWKNWFEGLTGTKVGQSRAPRKGDGGEEGGWEVGMGKRKGKGKGKGKEGKIGNEKGGGERDMNVEEENWWEVTKVLVGLWERDLREVREWDPSEQPVEEDDASSSLDPPLPLFLYQFPTDGSSNPRKPRSDIASVVKVIFDTYPKTRTVSKKGVEEDEEEVDFSRMDEVEEDERTEERREIAGRLMGLILTLTTPPTPFLSPSRYDIHLLSPFSHFPTSHLPQFFSLLPPTTPDSAVLVLLASLLNYDSSSPSGPPTPDLFVSKLVKIGGKTTKTLRSAVVKVLMMGRLEWSGEELESTRVELREGWREGFGVKGTGEEEEEMEVDGNETGGEGWRWVEEVGERIVEGLEGGEEEETGLDTVGE